MVATLELTDGTTTLDLYGTTYTPERGFLLPPPPVQLALAGNSLSRQTYGPREMSMPLTVYGTTVALLEANIRALEHMLAAAAERQVYNQTAVVLKTQLGDTDANDVEYRVLSGQYSLPPTILNKVDVTDNKASVRGTLTLLVEPLGRLAQVTLTQVTLENEQDGNNNNFVDIEGAFGPYQSFDGVDDDISVADQAAIQNIHDSGGSGEAWIYVKSDGEGNFGRIFDKGSWGVWVQDESGGKVKLTFNHAWSGTNGEWTTVSRAITLKEWTHIAWAYDSGGTGNNPTIWINAVKYEVGAASPFDLTEAVGPPSGTRTTDATIELVVGNRPAADRTFDGFIDDARLWSDTRSDAEILANYLKELVGNEAGLALYWPMNDSVGTIVRDHTSNGNNGTITGATWTIGGRPLGTEGGRMQIKIADEGTNPWNGSKKMWIYKVAGADRTDDLFIQGQDESSDTEGSEPATVTITYAFDGALSVTGAQGASGGQVAEIKYSADGGAPDKNLQTLFTSVGTVNYQIAGGSLPSGIYRVLVRGEPIQTGAQSNWLIGEVGFALGYNFGATTITPVSGEETAFSIAFDSFEILDIGELVIAPSNIPDGYTAPTLELRIHCILNTGGNSRTIESDTVGIIAWRIDCIYLVPFQEGLVIVEDVSASDRILIDDLSDAPGVYLLNSSDVVQKAATKTGGPFSIGPEPTRIGVIRDDLDDPSTIKFDVDIQHTPQTIGL